MTEIPQGSILGPLLFVLDTSVLMAPISYGNYHLYTNSIQIMYCFKKGEVDLLASLQNLACVKKYY